MTSKSFGLLLAVTLVTAGALAGALTEPGLDEYAALDRLTAANLPLVLKFQEVSLARLFVGVGASTGVKIDLSALPEPERTVSIATALKGTLKEVLTQLARDYELAYEVVGPDKLVVRSELGLAPVRTLDEYAPLDHLTAASIPVQLTFNQVPLAMILEAMGRATGVEIDLTSLPAISTSVDTGLVTFKEALVQLARENKLAYEVVGTDRLIVRLKSLG